MTSDAEDRIEAELVGLRNEMRDGREDIGELKGMVSQFMQHHEDRARRTSDRVKSIEVRTSGLEKWRWVLAGAWVSIPVAWAVFQALQGGQ